MKGFLKNYGFYIVVVLILLLACSYGWFVSPIGIFPIGEDLSKGDWLSFWSSFLSFAGSLILGSVAVWQNKKLCNLNYRIQERQMREKRGVLFPVKNESENKALVHLQDIQKGQLIFGKENYDHADSILGINLQNRGTDFIHECELISATINNVSIAVKPIPLMIEKGETILYGLDLYQYEKSYGDKLDTLNLKMHFKMQNSCGCEYYEIFTAICKIISINNTYRYSSYNYKLKEIDNKPII